jgi:hypothetical protein
MVSVSASDVEPGRSIAVIKTFYSKQLDYERGQGSKDLWKGK